MSDFTKAPFYNVVYYERQFTCSTVYKTHTEKQPTYLTRTYLKIYTHTTHCITKALGNVSISSVVVSCTPPPGPCTSHSVPPLWPVC